MTKQQQQHWEVVIKGPLEKVFDLVTVAALWPHWIPITRAVSGVSAPAVDWWIPVRLVWFNSVYYIRELDCVLDRGITVTNHSITLLHLYKPRKMLSTYRQIKLHMTLKAILAELLSKRFPSTLVDDNITQLLHCFFSV